jgi:hypothetical protein|tara:strand:- start:1330 stop:1920 length:591 start_codon:yes stop_codon:yes gene_type:complete
MAENIDKTVLKDEEATSFNAPIPGESLTTSPDTPNSWERPPLYTTQERAMEELYLLMTEKERLTELVKIIDDGVPLDEIAQVILYKGYTEGQYNPDLMLIMIEPTLYLLIAIADYAGIKDYVLYEGEDDDPDTEIPNDNVTPVNMDDDEGETSNEEKPKVVEPEEDVVGKSLLSRIKKELPSKVKEVVNINEEEVE